MPNTEVKIIDPETRRHGYRSVRSASCASGLSRHGGLPRDARTAAEAIDEDGWLHTGDLAAMDERGYCTVEGRLKDMIIRGGENIYPKELEEMLLAASRQWPRSPWSVSRRQVRARSSAHSSVLSPERPSTPSSPPSPPDLAPAGVPCSRSCAWWHDWQLTGQSVT